MSIPIGINGVGRIGRAVLRIILQRNDLEVVAINDINPDIHNIAYLIKYDSIYGRLPHSVEVVESRGDRIVIGDEKSIRVTHHSDIASVPWKEFGADVVVDSSGVRQNLIAARGLKSKGIRRVIVTNSPAEKDVDATIILGANQDTFDPRRHFLVSSSICDANAFVPVANILDKNFGIEHGFLTTLHPWLSYQNLLDGPSISYATPGQIHDHYALGRASVGSLIPKTTSAISASEKVLKHLKGRFLSMSFRIPTMISSAADLSVQLKSKTNADAIRRLFEDEEKKQSWKILHNNKEALVSADFTGVEHSAVVDHRWLMINEHNYLKMVLWYDNEWGYSSRVADLAAFMGQKENA